MSPKSKHFQDLPLTHLFLQSYTCIFQ